MNKQVSANASRILAKLGFAEADITKADKDRVVATVRTKFPSVRKALSHQYGACEHNIAIGKGRRATWVINGKGTIVCKGAMQGPITVSFSTMPRIEA